MLQASVGNSNYPGIPKEIVDSPEGRDTGALTEEVTHVLEACHIVNYQKIKSNMLCLLMRPVVFCKTIRSVKLLCGAKHEESQNLLKEKVN